MKSVFLIVLFAIIPSVLLKTEPIPVRMDVNHSNIGFAVPILGGLSEVHGKFSVFDMDLKYDAENITRSSVRVNIKAESIDTGIDQRDQHLRTADFFEVSKYPEIVFESQKIEQTDDGLVLYGNLTIHGISREVAIPFKVTGKRVDEKESRFVIGFSGSLTLNRRDFGINYTHQTVPDFVGDDVRIEINLISRSNKLAPASEGGES